MPGNLTLYLNVRDFCFARSLTNGAPLEQPLRLVQTADYSADIYFLEPTDDPAAPWTVLDPSGFTNFAIELADPLALEVEALAFSNTFTVLSDHINMPLNLFTVEMTLALGANRAKQCVFEVAYQNGAIIEPIQVDCFVAKGLIGNSSGPPSPITYPPYYFLTRAQALSLFVQNQFGINALTGGTSTDLDGIPTADGQATAGWIVRINNPQGEWLLQAGAFPTGGTPLNGYVRPADYDLTDPLYWIEIG